MMLMARASDLTKFRANNVCDISSAVEIETLQEKDGIVCAVPYVNLCLFAYS